MGLIDFVKSAGEKLFGRDDKGAVAGESPEVIARRKARLLGETVEKLGFEVENLGISINGDVATVSGKVGSHETREKIVLVVGNTEGIAQVDDQITVDEAPQATFYTVVSGDTLSKIAKEHYGDAMKYPVIFEANKPMLTDPDKIYPGQVLRIPPIEG